MPWTKLTLGGLRGPSWQRLRKDIRETGREVEIHTKCL